MNLAAIKLILAALWLVPGVAFLVLEWTSGTVVALPVAGRQVPLAWPFIALGLFNLLRWWTSRPPRTPDWIEHRRSRRPSDQGPDANFKFDEDI